MKEVTIQFTDDEWQEIEDHLAYWNDESYPIHAGYALRDALQRAGYIVKRLTL